MPFSSESGKAYVRNIVGRVKHERMLDIGCGSGTYAKMFPEAHWTGVEVWEPYIEEFKLKDLYQQLILADVTDVKLKEFGHFDVAILGDVLEHMEKDKAKFLLGFIKSIADTVIVSIPIGHYPQDEYNGNPYEKHITDNWTDEDFRATFGEPTVGYIENEIGVYCWSNQKVRPKICVYTISKNEEKFVKRWADSAKDADLLVIADTGSDDRTVEIAKECGIQGMKSASRLGGLTMHATRILPLFRKMWTSASAWTSTKCSSPAGAKRLNASGHRALHVCVICSTGGWA
jgi:SAM-dependent methyltransferase